jgi:hypothetical protein
MDFIIIFLIYIFNFITAQNDKDNNNQFMILNSRYYSCQQAVREKPLPQCGIFNIYKIHAFLEGQEKDIQILSSSEGRIRDGPHKSSI